MIMYFKQSIDANNVLNIDTERFFREAEDYFYFFDRQDKAEKKLQTAIELTPDHVKSIKFLGDVYFAGGKMEKAFDCYAQAAALQPDNVCLLSSLAVVCEALNKFQTAFDFINLAFEKYTSKYYKIYTQMCDLKFSLLVKLRKYKEAKNFLKHVKRVLPVEEAELISSFTVAQSLQKKLSLKERMENLNIKVV